MTTTIADLKTAADAQAAATAQLSAQVAAGVALQKKLHDDLLNAIAANDPVAMQAVADELAVNTAQTVADATSLAASNAANDVAATIVAAP